MRDSSNTSAIVSQLPLSCNIGVNAVMGAERSKTLLEVMSVVMISWFKQLC